MFQIDPSLEPKHFAVVAEALESQALSVKNEQENIEKSPKWRQFILNIFSPDSVRMVPLAKSCSALLDRIETIETVFSGDPSQIELQKKNYAACLKTTRTAISILSTSKSTKVKAELSVLVQKVVGLQYRIEGVNGGFDRAQADQGLTEKLCEAALKWKNNYPLIARKTLNDREVKILEEASTYPEFAHLLLANPAMHDAFFNWTLREGNSVSLFVEFPAVAARLKASFISSRVGRLGVEAFQNRVEKKDAPGVFVKDVKLPFFIKNMTEYVSILDDSREVELNGGLVLTLKKAFSIFGNKNREVGNLEMFKQGITNWNCHELGSYNPETGTYDRIDLTADDFWKQLPILEEVSKETLEGRLGDKVEEGEFVVFAKASRTTPDLDLDGRHGYLEVAIPLGNGNYGIYPFGIFPRTFPHTIIDLILFLGNTFRAKVAYPDENFFYSHRQQASHPMKLTNEEGQTFLKTLQKELIMSRFGHRIFQFGAENCAYWAQTTLNTIKSKIHNFYKIDYVKSYPLNPLLKWIFAFFRSLPNSIRNYGIRAVDTLFGTGRGIEIFDYQKRIFKSHKTSHVRNEFVIYQPGYLHQQIENGEIKGQISTGYS